MIRLTLMLVAAMAAAMLIWGKDTPEMRAEAIEEAVLEEIETVVVAEPVVAPAPVAEPSANVVETTPSVDTNAVTEAVAEAAQALDDNDSDVEVAQLNRIDLTGTTSGLLQFNAADAAAEAAQPVEAPQAARILIVTGNRVNMREGPSTSRSVVGRLREGDKAELMAEAPDGWVQVRAVASGQTGFMAARFLQPAQ
ncbi:MAG: SH3 domain-containing protein [Rhodobacter sp.]|nr:SH3 domain-containing protein [Rhodobacter sp.]